MHGEGKGNSVNRTVKIALVVIVILTALYYVIWLTSRTIT